MTSSLVNDRVQSLLSLSRSRRKRRLIVQSTSLRFRSRSMKKLNRFSLNRQYEISISIVLQIFECRIFSKRLISIRLEKNSWKRKNVSIAMNQIISVKIVRNLENSKLSKWTWKMIQRSREKSNLRKRRYENEKLDHLIIFDEEWFLRWDIRVDKLCVERQNLHNNNDKHWCHWIRIRWWVNRASTLWSSKDRVCSIDKETIDKSLWWMKRSSYHSCYLFKNDHSETYSKSYFYVDYQIETANINTK